MTSFAVPLYDNQFTCVSSTSLQLAQLDRMTLIFDLDLKNYTYNEEYFC